MQDSDIPTKITTPFGTNATPGVTIRTVPLTTPDPNAASFDLGFPPNTFVAEGAGGQPPDGRDFNGLLFQMTSWTRWFIAGGPVGYDAAFAAAVGGYPKGAIVAATIFGYFWMNTVDGNTSDPDAAGANWVAFSLLGGDSTGDAKLTLQTVAPPGWVMANDGTIGDATSGASLASSTTAALFALLYANVTDTYAPLFTSGGVPTSRAVQGTSAAAYAAHCRVSLTKNLGRALAIAGAGSGLTNRALGQTLGEETHALTLAENGPHTHTGTTDSGGVDHTHPNQDNQTVGGPSGGLRGSGNFASATGAASAYLHTHSFTTGSSGSGTGHNNMQPTSFWNIRIKL